MNAFVSFFLFCQALGAAIGAVMALWSEFAYLRAIQDGKVDVAERRHIDIIAKGLRFGMTLLLLSSLGLVVTAYTLNAAPQPALTPSYWILILLSVLIICISWALSRRRVSFTLGSAVIFTSWWFLSYLTLGWLPAFSFGSAVALLVVATAVIYAVFYYIRFLSGHLAQKGN